MLYLAWWLVRLPLPARFVCPAAPMPDADIRTVAQGQKSPQNMFTG